MDDDDDDVIGAAIFCKVCAPIFSENSYERWAKYWQIWRQIRYFDHVHNQYPFPRRHHQSLRDVEEAAAQGCYICSRLNLNGYEYHSKPIAFMYRLSQVSGSLWSRNHYYELCIEDRNFPSRSEDTIIIKPRPSQSALEELANRSNFRAWTGHEDIAVLARAWLDDCLRNHTDCPKSLTTGWKPSRLLDVSEDQIRLVLGDSEDVHGFYATLSHCWGTIEFPVLTTNQLARFFEGVDISEFPLTFQEAISTVRRLGIRYLWIDCYCIIQGSDDKALADWIHESLRMGKVYANSLLNIGALESNGPSHGLFAYRPSSATSARINWSPTRRDGPGVFYLRAPHQDVWDFDTAFAKLSSSPLMCRGWVFQECVNAPRMLSFGADEVFWQCSQLAACELFPDQDEPANEDLIQDHPFWLFRNRVTVPWLNAFDIRRRWIGALETYGNSQLTYPEKDLFVALDGVGAELEKFSGNLFRYGMLASTLPETLLFQIPRRNTGSVGVPMTTDSTRPSWHWSSCYSRLDFSRLRFFYDRKTFSGCTLFPMAYAFMSDDCRPLPNSSSRDYWPNILLIGRLLEKKPRYTWCNIDDNPKKITFGSAFEQAEEFYIPLIGGTTVQNGRYSFMGLVLVRAESGSAGVYRRKGIFEFWAFEFLTEFLALRPQIVVLE
ncbi:heterokaryon incompatibility protein-domain-containing protein [Xylariaceae sp. AK1471]|nr:heterokaryon incompatibility protein-domain-containing protein [Xylariaceae sp. AK1471]